MYVLAYTVLHSQLASMERKAWNLREVERLCMFGKKGNLVHLTKDNGDFLYYFAEEQVKVC